jgi:hypothetical protein
MPFACWDTFRGLQRDQILVSGHALTKMNYLAILIAEFKFLVRLHARRARVLVEDQSAD